MAMAEIIGAAIEMQIDQAAARHVMEEIAVAPVDHQIDARLLPELRLVGIPIANGGIEEILLGVELEVTIIVHNCSFGHKTPDFQPRLKQAQQTFLVKR